MRQRRWRKMVLWGGCALCVLIAAAFAASGFYLVALNVGDSGPIVAVSEGAAFIEQSDYSNIAFFASPLEWIARQRAPHWAMWNAWSIRPTTELFVPLYAVFLAVALPTLLVWRFVAKFPRGHCRRCGYNLTGLTEARCPECGRSIQTICS